MEAKESNGNIKNGIEMHKLYPECWQNDDRMNALMSPFRPRSVNPENYDAKIAFWKEMISKYCKLKGDPCFNKKDVQMAFERKGRVPYDLDTVVDDMCANSEVRLKSEFMYDPLNSWSRWAISSFVKKPLYWGVSKILSQSKDDNPAYVLLELAKNMTDDLNTHLQKYSGQILHYADLKDRIKGLVNLNANGLEICLHSLLHQKKIAVDYIVEDGEKKIDLIKVPKKGDDASITDTDRAIYNLEKTKKSLTTQLESLEDDIKLNEEMTRKHLREGKKQLAKTYLRKKHLLEKKHEKRSLALHNIETILTSVEETLSNGEVMDAYKLGSKALQVVLSKSDLKLDNVDQVVSDIRESVETSNEIQDCLGNVNLNESYDDSALEDELRDILSENESTEMLNNNEQVKEQPQLDNQELIQLLEALEVENKSPVTVENEVTPEAKSRLMEKV